VEVEWQTKQVVLSLSCCLCLDTCGTLVNYLVNYLCCDVIIKYYLCFIYLDLSEINFHIKCFIYVCKLGAK
jgi:hypothetical protein